MVTKNPRPTPANSRAEILESYLAFSISVSDNTVNMSPKAAAKSGDAIPNNKEPKRPTRMKGNSGIFIAINLLYKVILLCLKVSSSMSFLVTFEISLFVVL